MPCFAAIDVGSNAIRLRIVEAEGPSPGAGARVQLPLLPTESAWREVASVRAPVRLGGEVFLTGKLAPTSIGRACAAFKDFRREMDAAKVVAYRATATSAVREAANGTTLVERARREAGIDLEIIYGIEEARLIQLAVTRRLALEDRRVLLIDVGGGSTELTVLDKGQSSFSISLPLGSVRLLEAFMKDATTVSKEMTRIVQEAVDRALVEARPQLSRLTGAAFTAGGPDALTLVGTGGNIETLATLCPAKDRAPGELAADVAEMRALFPKLCAMSPAERARTYGLRPDRADTIVPAAAIFLRIAESLGASTIVTPQVGLKDGILEELVDKHFQVWDVLREAENVLGACMRLGQRFQFDEAHGAHVARLAARLFDDLHDEHQLSDRDRLLMRAAALLHDVGDFVRYDGHHKHSYYLIQNSDIMGLTPDERAIIANVARYHRKSGPDPSHPNFRDLDKESRGKVRALAAMLRIADALDREHLGKVRNVWATIESGKGRVLLKIDGDHERELEEWTVRAKAGLFRDVFGLEIVIG
ncbi:Ppx/GppA family phosphatase [Pendulispora rubella]|uniref:Ppx/GppA family phosphatase n=1 Tax=Pendulispora rubella TaxID=2741070 RepID=A0ABZ2LD18_9BACT